MEHRKETPPQSRKTTNTLSHSLFHTLRISDLAISLRRATTHAQCLTASLLSLYLRLLLLLLRLLHGLWLWLILGIGHGTKVRGHHRIRIGVVQIELLQIAHILLHRRNALCLLQTRRTSLLLLRLLRLSLLLCKVHALRSLMLLLRLLWMLPLILIVIAIAIASSTAIVIHIAVVAISISISSVAIVLSHALMVRLSVLHPPIPTLPVTATISFISTSALSLSLRCPLSLSMPLSSLRLLTVVAVIITAMLCLRVAVTASVIALRIISAR